MKNFLFAGIILLLSAFSSSEKGSAYRVNSYEVDCVGLSPKKCLLVQKGEIENVPADALSIKYHLIEVLEKQKDPGMALNGTWDAFRINGSVIRPSPNPGEGLIPQIEININEMAISGKNGCNNFRMQILSIKDHEIELGPIAATHKMCPDMTIADSFDKAMNDIKKFKVEDGNLKFLSEDGNELLEFKKGIEPIVLLNDTWVAEIVDGTAVQDMANAPRLEVHTARMEVMGGDGCNSFKGKITKLSNKELVFGPMASTKKACPDMIFPDKFNIAMAQVRKYKISGTNLILLDEQEEVLVVLKKTD